MRTLYVVVFISHGRRHIVHVNVTRHPTAAWVWRQLIEATPWGSQPRFLIRDRDRSYGADFVAKANRLGIRTVLTPVRAPNANAVAERVIGTLLDPRPSGCGFGTLYDVTFVEVSADDWARYRERLAGN